MMHLTNHIKAIVQGMLSLMGVPRWGIVTNVDPVNGLVKVMYQPENILSGWLPAKCFAAGQLTVIALPSKGDQVQVHPDGGDMEHGVVSGAAHYIGNLPPVSPATGKQAQPGEFLVQVGSTCLHIVNGTIYVNGNLTVTGNITATGDITGGYGGADAIDMQHHTHTVPNVQSGSGTITTSGPVAGT